jgi:hypothetical protein
MIAALPGMHRPVARVAKIAVLPNFSFLAVAIIPIELTISEIIERCAVGTATNLVSVCLM